jgi:hypothetical protein
MGYMVRNSRATSRSIVRQFAVVDSNPKEVEEKKNRLRAIFRDVDALTVLKILAEFSVETVCAITPVLQERRKLYRFFLKHIRNEARMNQLEITIEQEFFVQRAERAAAENESHLKRAREESERATLADQNGALK